MSTEARAAVFQLVGRRIAVDPGARGVGVVELHDGGRCLSIKDPWIKLVGLGEKPYELRKTRTHYRGPVVLCSSGTPSRTDDARAARERYRGSKPWQPEPFGFALYIGNLIDCMPATAEHAEHACCMPVEGEYVWHFANVRPLPRPQPIKGMLGLYRLPMSLRRYLKSCKLL